MKLSILIPSVFERDARPLLDKLNKQIGTREVELLVLTDNRKRSLGLKRMILMGAAQGDYLTHIDDDDSVSDDYVDSVLDAIDAQAADPPDVIVFNSESRLLGYGFGENPFVVRTGIEYENEESRMEGDRRVDITRKPWHWCVWRSALAKTADFPDGYIDEDWYWLRQLMPKIKKQHRIDKVLHYYCYNAATSLAAQGAPTCT